MESGQPIELTWGRIALVSGVAILAGVLVWLLVIRADDSDRPAPEIARPGEGPVASDASQLSELQDRLGHPVYWAGEQGSAGIELTRTADDRVFVRYLAEGANVGDARSDFLTIGTYPVEDAYGTLDEQSHRPGASVEQTPDGGLVVANESNPTSVYIAYPGQNIQVEVYDPDPALALRLAVSGDVRPAD